MNRPLPDNWLDSWNTRDPTAVAALMSPGSTWRDPSSTTPAGLDQIQDVPSRADDGGLRARRLDQCVAAAAPFW
jgi:nuclear transport factor 2 (NTF2) superfamily protein